MDPLLEIIPIFVKKIFGKFLYLWYMKFIITESQYSGLIDKIKKYQRDIDFLRKNMKLMVERDVDEYIQKTFDISSMRNDGRSNIYRIEPEHLISKLKKYNGVKPHLWISVTSGMNKIQVWILYSGIPIHDTNSIIKWDWGTDENGEEVFYSKLNKVINKKLSIPYQDKLIEKIKVSLSKPRGTIYGI